jgi:cupin fold WbuC family metalloprotein
LGLRTRRQDAEVLYADERLPLVGSSDLTPLMEDARHTPRRRMRLCVHPDTGSALHEMFIASRREGYIRPHKHVEKAESLLLLEGSADLVLFSDEGRVLEVVGLGDYASGRPFYYRIQDSRYHTLLVNSEVVLYHEATSGPWARSQMAYAPWSPADDDTAGQSALLHRIRREAAELATRQRR